MPSEGISQGVSQWKEQTFKGDKRVWWEQGDVTQGMLQLEHCQDFSRPPVKLKVAILEMKGLSQPCHCRAKQRRKGWEGVK